MIVPSAGIGIVVLTNAAPTGAPEALAAEFMDLVQFGKIERDWLTGLRRAYAAMSQPVGSLVGKQGPEKRTACRSPCCLCRHLCRTIITGRRR